MPGEDTITEATRLHRKERRRVTSCCSLVGSLQNRSRRTSPMTTSIEEQDEIRERRTEELEALQAYYGDDLLLALSTSLLLIDGPWFLRLRTRQPRRNNNGDKNTSKLGESIVNDDIIGLEPTLEIKLSPLYPLGNDAPVPLLHNVMMDPALMQDLLSELQSLYESGTDVGILWGERCREGLERGDMKCTFDEDHSAAHNSSASRSNDLDNNDNDGADAPTTAEETVTHGRIGGGGGDMKTFIPPNGTKYGQPTRRFPTAVIGPHSTFRVSKMIRTLPFKPPRSGPSELMISNVCSVTCIEQVQWALAELLFNDKRISKATHNMFAYRFTTTTKQDDGDMIVSDNDDDGEKGSGNKLASLLELCNANNVLVVVSRWFGGIHLGSARFKWIASVARDGLEQGGFIKN